MQKDGNTLPTTEVLKFYNGQKVWDQCMEESGWEDRKRQVEEFNR